MEEMWKKWMIASHYDDAEKLLSTWRYLARLQTESKTLEWKRPWYRWHNFYYFARFLRLHLPHITVDNSYNWAMVRWNMPKGKNLGQKTKFDYKNQQKNKFGWPSGQRSTSRKLIAAATLSWSLFILFDTNRAWLKLNCHLVGGCLMDNNATSILYG